MKKGLLTITILALAGSLFIAGNALKAADLPEKISIENDGYKKDKKGPVPFSHSKHSTEYDVSCDECHHEYTDGKNTWKEGDPVKKCAECHDLEKSDGKIKKLKIAFHKNCKNCHKEAGGDAPFKKCNDCHSKK